MLAKPTRTCPSWVLLNCQNLCMGCRNVSVFGLIQVEPQLSEDSKHGTLTIGLLFWSCQFVGHGGISIQLPSTYSRVGEGKAQNARQQNKQRPKAARFILKDPYSGSKYSNKRVSTQNHDCDLQYRNPTYPHVWVLWTLRRCSVAESERPGIGRALATEKS